MKLLLGLLTFLAVSGFTTITGRSQNGVQSDAGGERLGHRRLRCPEMLADLPSVTVHSASWGVSRRQLLTHWASAEW